jgi:pimeloyl-ACP methyl ester carboxylesterase
MIERLPHAELAVIADAGHQVPLHQPGEFVRVIRDFLEKA